MIYSNGLINYLLPYAFTILFNVRADIFVIFSYYFPIPDPNKPINLIINLGYLANATYFL